MASNLKTSRLPSPPALRSIAPDISVAIVSERARITSIMESPEGIARPQAALHLALKGGMAAQDAIEFLRTMPAVAADNPYVAALEREAVNLGGPNVGAAHAAGSKEARLAELNVSMAHHNAIKGYRKAKAGS